jgi:hypothetical protein
MCVVNDHVVLLGHGIVVVDDEARARAKAFGKMASQEIADTLFRPLSDETSVRYRREFTQVLP